MAKRIIISFSNNPTIGTGFNIGIVINDLAIVYDSGEVYMSIDYDTTDVIPNKIKLQPTLSDSIDKTLSFLKENWTADFISYKRVADTIEMLVIADDLSITNGILNTNITLAIENVSNAENLGLRYFFQYTNVVNDTFLCQIYKRYYLDLPTEINGSATIQKGDIKDHLDTIRGTGLSLKLEASLDLTLEDLYTQDEQDFTVKFYKNDKIIFRGFLKPDGIYQSFVRDNWIISMDCVDGLGALSNLSFVKDNGLRFVGKMKASDIVYYCLRRTGISLPINTSINTIYDGLTPSDGLDILTKIQLSADRFFKNDGQSSIDSTIMSCEEVLKSVLVIFSATITQEDGEWYIFKPNEIYANPFVLFRKYDIDNVYSGTKTINLNKIVGSQVDNYYPHHSGANQKIEIKGGVSAFRLGYKYGFLEGILPNPSLLHTGLVYDHWTVLNDTFLINDPLKSAGILILNNNGAPAPDMMISDPISVLATDDLALSISFSALNNNGTPKNYLFLILEIKHGVNYLKYTPKNNLTPIDDAVNAVWTTTPSHYIIVLNGIGSYNIPIPTFLSDADLTITVVEALGGAGFTTINRLDFTSKTGARPEIGEFHTVSRNVKVSSIVKENKSVSNGDNLFKFYSGIIFKEDGVTPTQTWSRKGSFESYPLLRIAAEEELRIAQKPIKIFRGSIFGFIPYFSLIEINGIGKFLPIEYSYDTKENSIDFKLLELYSAEIPDILYKFTYDYGNTVKPTIIG